MFVIYTATQNVFPNFLVCGVVVLSDDEGMNLVVLGYDSQIDMKAAVVSCLHLCYYL